MIAIKSGALRIVSFCWLRYVLRRVCRGEDQPSGLLMTILILAALLLPAGLAAAQDVDEGERWYPDILERQEVRLNTSAAQRATPKPYLPDYSYAGYRWGEQPLPLPEGQVIDVSGYGAVPDDGEDDTEAVREALAEAHNHSGPVIVRFPPGRFIIREILFIERSNVVLQGSGSGASGTTLYVPRPLKEMDVPSGYEKPLSNGTSRFSYRGGVIWTRLPEPAEERTLARATAGRRGYHNVKVDHVPGGVEVGDVVRIRWYNREGARSSLLNHIFCSGDLPFGERLYEDSGRSVTTQEVTIADIRGRVLVTKEPLLLDLRRKWRAEVSTVHFLENVGIEGLRIAFPDAEYAGHHEEEGYNGFYLTDLMHSWVRDVAIVNADSGVLSDRGKNITAEKVRVLGRRGHYSLHVGSVYGALVKDFSIESGSVHNPSFNTYSRLSVFTDGAIHQPKLDQHRGVNHQNLFDNLEAIYERPWTDGLFRHGGSKNKWGPVAGAFNTFWNVRVRFLREDGRSTVRVGDIDTAPHGRIVGLRGLGRISVDLNYGPSAYIEGLNQGGIAVPSLYEFQFQQRLEKRRPLSLAIYNPLPGDRFEEGEAVTIEAAAVDEQQRIERVVFFADSLEIGIDTDGRDGWRVEWRNPPSGLHTLHAVAYDSEGRSVTSTPLSCTGEDVSVWIGEGEGELGRNYPNPFTRRSTIEYTLADDTYVQLELYDIRGRRVAVLVDDMRSAGRHAVRIDGSELSSGVYFYRLRTDAFSMAKKAIVVR